MEKISPIALALLLSLTPSLHAETTTLTWPQAVQIASEHNADLRASRENVLSEQAAYYGSFNGLSPRLNLTSSYNDSKAGNESTRWRAGGSASIDVFNMSRIANIRSSSASLRQAQASFDLTASTVFSDLRRAFVGVLYAQEQSKVSDTIRDLRKKNADLVTLRYRSGRESKGNMLRAQAELLQAEINSTQALRDLQSTQEELRFRLGTGGTEPLSATGKLGAVEAATTTTTTWELLVEEHPSVILSRAQVDAARASLADARSALWPSLTANYNRSFADRDYFPGNPDWSASGVVSLPIFGGGLTAAYHDISSSRKNFNRSEEELRSTREGVRSDLQSSWGSFLRAVDQVKVQDAFLEAARQRNGEADIRYANGLMNYENWEQIVTDRVNFEKSLIQAQRDAVNAEAAWDRSRGKGIGN